MGGCVRPANVRHSFIGFIELCAAYFPDCITQTQAVAFNIFVASFPMLLLVLGTVASSDAFQQALMGMIVRLRPVLPPGSVAIFSSFLSRHSTHPWQWVLLGSGGTLIAGTQMMKLSDGRLSPWCTATSSVRVR